MSDVTVSSRSIQIGPRGGLTVEGRLAVEHAAEVTGVVRAPDAHEAFGIAAGEIALDGENPTTVATGLHRILSATATLKQPHAPADDPSWLTVDYADGELSIYAWRNTGVTDPMLVASNNSAAVVSWVAVGIPG